uniref:Ubiquitin conjugating enzyme E2 U n=1 Tax=Balaenoptera musculus TaxID=9771 RepID=A0A8C0CE32_BALMU
MYSRAYILLQREFQELKKNNYEGITGFPVSEDMMQWEVDIEGLQNTVWHGLCFQNQFTFLKVLDPHTGRPCIDFLDNTHKWNRTYTLSSILLTLQVMLSNPVLENPVNLEAAHILIKDETLYRQIILRLFHQPLQCKKCLHIVICQSIKSVSFNDYYKTWSGIATSKATEYYRTPLLEDPDFTGEYYKWKKNELRRPKEWGLKYAAAMARIARENKKPHKTSYPTERSYLCTTPVHTFPDSQTETDIVTKTDETKERWKRKVLPDDVSTNEPWEEEVEDLVAWTNTLDTDALED